MVMGLSHQLFHRHDDEYRSLPLLQASGPPHSSRTFTLAQNPYPCRRQRDMISKYSILLPVIYEKKNKRGTLGKRNQYDTDSTPYNVPSGS